MMIGAALVNNVILARFLGLCSFMGVTTRIDTAAGMGLATTFVITVSSMADWAVQTYLLAPYGLGFLRTVTFILVIASAVQFTELTVRKVSPSLFQMLGIYLPLITTNCAVLGVALLLVESHMNIAGRKPHEFPGKHALRLRLFSGLQPGDGDFCRVARAPGAGAGTASVRGAADRLHRRQSAGDGVHGFFRYQHRLTRRSSCGLPSLV